MPGQVLATSWSSTLSAAPNPVAPGATTQVTATVKIDNKSAASNMVVDFEFYDATNTRVGIRSYTGENFTKGQTKTYSFPLTVPNAAGPLSGDVGVFTQNWAQNVYWGNAVATITVGTQPTPTPIPPTPTPVPPTPTPIPPTPTPTPPPPCLGVQAYPEFRSENTSANMTVVAPLTGYNPADAFAPYYAQITGDCQGTTEQILEWAAVKWGFGSQPSVLGGPALGRYRELAKADAIAESWWRQGSVNPDGPTYGINQVKCGVWPDCEKAGQSTAFAADYAMAVIRAHYDGVLWTGDGTRGSVWNAVAAWECGCGYSGTDGYATYVQEYLSQRSWDTASPWYCNPNAYAGWFCGS